MNFKTTIVILVLLAALGGFVFLMRDKAPDYSQVNKEHELAKQGESIFSTSDIDPLAINQVVLAQNGKTVGQLHKQDHDWYEVDPVHFPMISPRIETFIQDVAGLKYVDSFTPGKNQLPSLDKLGLAPARWSITLTAAPKPVNSDSENNQASTQSIATEKVKSIRVDVGRTIVGGKIYIAVQGRTQVYVAPDDISSYLQDKPIEAWRSRKLPFAQLNQTEKLSLSVVPTQAQEADVEQKSSTSQPSHSDTPVMTTVTKSQGQWFLSSPDNGRANEEAIASLVSSLTSMTIEKFTADAPSDMSIYGLNTPRLSLSITSTLPASPDADNAKSKVRHITQSFKIGAPTDLDSQHYFAVWSRGQQGDVVFTVPANVLEQLSKLPNDLRSQSLTPMQQGQVQAFSITHGTQHLAFTHSAKGWAFGQAQKPSVDFKADDQTVSNTLAKLLQARSTVFLPSKKKPNIDPLVTIKLTGLGGQLDVLQAWPYQTKSEMQADSAKPKKPVIRWLILRNEEPMGRVVDSKALSGILDLPWAFRDRELARLDPNQINHIQIKQIDGAVVELSRKVPSKVANQATTQSASGAKSDHKRTEPIDSATPWQLKGFEHPNITLVQTIVDAISPLKATVWRQPLLTLTEPRTQLIVNTQDGGHLELLVDEQGNAQLKGIDQVFKIAPEFQHALEGDFADRTVLGIDRDQVSQVERIIGKQALTLRMNEKKQYEIVEKPPVIVSETLDQNKVASLFDTLIGLRVSRWVSAPSDISKTPNAQLRVTDKSGKTQSLLIYQQAGSKGQYLAQFNDRWFEIPLDQSQKLLANLDATKK